MFDLRPTARIRVRSAENKKNHHQDKARASSLKSLHLTKQAGKSRSRSLLALTSTTIAPTVAERHSLSMVAVPSGNTLMVGMAYMNDVACMANVAYMACDLSDLSYLSGLLERSTSSVCSRLPLISGVALSQYYYN